MLKIRSVLLLSATSALLFALPLSTHAQAPAAQVTCKDGSMSAGGRGACSGKGGVDKKATAAAAKVAKDAKAATVKAAKADKAAAARAAKATKNAAAKATKGVEAPAPAKPAPAASKTVPPATAVPPARPTPTPAKPATASAAKAGAPTAKCKDGSLSYSKTHTGACSSHGGVGEWLDGTAKKP